MATVLKPFNMKRQVWIEQVPELAKKVLDFRPYMPLHVFPKQGLNLMRGRARSSLLKSTLTL